MNGRSDGEHTGHDRIERMSDYFVGIRIAATAIGSPNRALGETPLPEDIVLLGLWVGFSSDGPATADLALAFGDVLPADNAEFRTLQNLFPFMPRNSDGIPSFQLLDDGVVGFNQLNIALHPGGRRLVALGDVLGGGNAELWATLLIRSV